MMSVTGAAAVPLFLLCFKLFYVTLYVSGLVSSCFKLLLSVIIIIIISLPAQEPQTAVTSASPATGTISRSRSWATVQSVANTSTYRILRNNQSSATTPAAESAGATVRPLL